MRKFLTTTAVLSLPAFAFATNNLVNALVNALPNLLGPIAFFIFAPWLFLVGYGVWRLFRGGGND